MLHRNLDRIARELSYELVATLRQASVEELAEFLPAVNRLLKQQRVSPARSLPRAPVAARARYSPPPLRSNAVAASLGDAVIRTLRTRPQGLRSEEIQQNIAANARELRIVLADLVNSGRVARHGQARGTRYALSENASSLSSSNPKERHASGSEEEVEVDVDAMNEIRKHLANSVVPMTLVELENASGLERPQLRGILERLMSLRLAERSGQGPGARYKLAVRASSEARSEGSGGAPRVVRRAPRAKGWQPTTSHESSEAAEHATSHAGGESGYEGSEEESSHEENEDVESGTASPAHQAGPMHAHEHEEAAEAQEGSESYSHDGSDEEVSHNAEEAY